MGGGERARPGLVLLALSCFAAAASGQCIIGLSVDSQRSRLTAAGQLIQPLPEPIIVNSTQQMSLSGKLFLSIPSGPCPTTPQAFVQSLAGSSIVTPADADPLSLQPSAIQAQVILMGHELLSCCSKCIRLLAGDQAPEACQQSAGCERI